MESGNVCRLSKVSLSLSPPAALRSAPPCTNTKDQVLRLHAPTAIAHFLPCSHLSLFTGVLFHSPAAVDTPPAHAHDPPSRIYAWIPVSLPFLARSRARAHEFFTPPKPLAHPFLHTCTPTHLFACPQHAHIHVSPTFPASSPAHTPSDRHLASQITTTPLPPRQPSSPRRLPTQGPGPVWWRRVAALLPPRLPGPQLFGLLSGYVAEGSFPLVLPIENKVSLYLMVMADVRRIWQMKRPFALKYCSLRRVSLPTHHDPIFFSGCLTRMTNELIFSVHRWEM